MACTKAKSRKGGNMNTNLLPGLIEQSEYQQLSQDLSRYVRALRVVESRSLAEVITDYQQNKSITGYIACKNMTNEYYRKVTSDFIRVLKKHYSSLSLARAFEMVETLFKIFEKHAVKENIAHLDQKELINAFSRSVYSSYNQAGVA